MPPRQMDSDRHRMPVPAFLQLRGKLTQPFGSDPDCGVSWGLDPDPEVKQMSGRHEG